MKKSPGAPARQVDARGPAGPFPWRGAWAVVGLAALLAAVTAVAYAPGLRGGFIWDDPDYVVNNPTLRTPGGLVTMWTNIFSLPQWYPLVHTTYWVEFQAYRGLGLGETPGLWPPGYKATNLVLHIATALLLWRLLRVLAVPGAYLAAFIFAVHPVHVESVAWITERKNTLSGLFYVAAFLVYWKWRFAPADSPRPERAQYLVAVALFACALLSKTVTATLPAAVLVVTWWKAGRIDLRRDVRPSIPFFVLGIAMGSVTAYLERHLVGAVGAEWDYAPTAAGEFAARLLIAGRAAWFYIGKLVWPADLAFMYERWAVDAGDWRQWLYPAAAAVVVAALLALALRRGGGFRAALAAALLFGGTLLPALGFFNVYPHRYAFVADHFQHLASIAVTTGLSAGLVLLLRRRPTPIAVAGGAVVLALSILTFRQAQTYESERTLWTHTVARSPGQWVAHTNLGKVLHDAGEIDASIAAHERALKLAPHVGDTWYNVGAIRASQQRWDEAEHAFRRAAELAGANRPGSAVQLDALIALSRIAVSQRNDLAAAEQLLEQARALRPEYPLTDYYLAGLRDRQGRVDEAFDLYVTATERMPAHFESHYNLGLMLLRLNQPVAAAEVLATAVGINPRSAEAWTNLGSAELALGRRERARFAFERALQISPALEPALRGRAAAVGEAGGQRP